MNSGRMLPLCSSWAEAPGYNSVADVAENPKKNADSAFRPIYEFGVGGSSGWASKHSKETQMNCPGQIAESSSISAEGAPSLYGSE
jgi:hypothetical protein